MLNSNILPIISSYEDLIEFNNSLPQTYQVLNIERVSYTKNIITVNREDFGIERFLYNYITNPYYLIGKVDRLKDYDFTKLTPLLYREAFAERFQEYINNLVLVGEKELTLWEFKLRLDESGITLTGFENLEAEEIMIPYFITSIGQNAFNCRSFDRKYKLRKVIFQEGSMLKYIGEAAFLGCQHLKEINLPESLTEIESGAFSTTGLESVILPDNIKVIKVSVFAYCENLKNIVLPKNLIYVLNMAFFKATSLRSIEFPTHFQSIDSSAFAHCIALKNVIFNKQLHSIGNRAFCGCLSLSVIKLPDSLIKIGDKAFADCTSLTDLVIPDRVEELGKSAFDYCKNLESVIIGKGVKKIAANAFLNCTKLKKVKILGNITKMGADVFAYTAIEELVLPSSVKECLYKLVEIQGYEPYDGPMLVVKNSIARDCKNLKSVKFR